MSHAIVKIIRPEGSVWVPHLKFNDTKVLYVPDYGIVAEVCGDKSYEIFTPEYKGNVFYLDRFAPEYCECRMAEDELFGFSKVVL